MYRARAEIVSGTRVYADGKWLRCIGNKNVSVGEYIWTDGRCVYGHLQESQQPKVITAQEDEGIPILLFAKGFHFYNYVSKLNQGYHPDDPIVAGAGSDEQSKYYFMINGYKRGVFWSVSVYEAGYATPNVYATNIDKKNNVYILVGTPSRLKISKNGEELITTDISDLIEQLRQEALSSIPGGGIPETPKTSGYLLRGRFAFIENENDWNALLFIYAYGYQNIIGEEVDVSYKRGLSTVINRTAHASGDKKFQSITTCLVNQDGYKILNRCIGTNFDLWGYEVQVADLTVGGHPYNWRTVVIDGKHDYSASISSPNNDVKIQLQDGFYFTIDEYPNFPSNMFCYPLFMKISIYTKTGKRLLTETFSTRSKITICKVGGQYLIGVRLCHSFGVKILDADTGYQASSGITITGEDGNSTNNKYEAYATGTPYVPEGLYLFDGKDLKKIAEGNCLNERLRPMAKYKNWQKHFKGL